MVHLSPAPDKSAIADMLAAAQFTRGHGALYDALAAGRIDDERFFSLLASELPQAVDGPQARAWIAEHDVIDHGLLDKALAGLVPALDADITLTPAGKHCTTLTLTGAYRTPLGAVGAGLDWGMWHGIATATIQAFLHLLTEALACPG
jgi:hypothetical protein